MHPSDHWQVIKDHGFYDIAPCDIMDEDGEIKIPINGGKHLKGINYVGSHIKNYDSMLVLAGNSDEYFLGTLFKTLLYLLGFASVTTFIEFKTFKYE